MLKSDHVYTSAQQCCSQQRIFFTTNDHSAHAGPEGISVPDICQRVGENSRRLAAKIREMIDTYGLTESRVQKFRQHSR